MTPELDFGLGIIHLDVLRARATRHRARLRRGGLLLISSLLLAIAVPIGYTAQAGTGTLVLGGDLPDAVLMLDGRRITTAAQAFASGSYTLQVTWPDAYPYTARVVVARDRVAQLAVPLRRHRPTVQTVPLPSPGAVWRAVQRDGDGWRLLAQAPATPQATPTTQGSAPLMAPDQILRLDARGLVRVAALETYPAADEVTPPSGRRWASYITDDRLQGARLQITTPTLEVDVPAPDPVRTLAWSPDGETLLVAVARGLGSNLLLWRAGDGAPDSAAVPVATIPGTIVAVEWKRDSQAALVLSRRAMPDAPGAPAPLDATLVLPGAAGAGRAITLGSPPPSALGMVPFAWDTDALYWVSATGSGLELATIPLSSALPTTLGSLPATTRALRVTDGRLQLVLAADVVLAVVNWPAQDTLATIDDVARVGVPVAAVRWEGADMLIAQGQTLTRLVFAPHALAVQP